MARSACFRIATNHLWWRIPRITACLRFSTQQQTTSQPPFIKLFGKATRIFPAASQHIRGAAFDTDGAVVAVKGSVNGRPFTLAKGTMLWNYHAKKLKKGRNIVRIFAVDDDGLQSDTLIVKIFRRTPSRF